VMTSGRHSGGVTGVIRAVVLTVSRRNVRPTASTRDTKALYETHTTETSRMAMDEDVCNDFARLVNEA